VEITVMSRQFFFRSCLTILMTAPVVALAGSADDSGSQVVVPLVIHDVRHDSRLFVKNHEVNPLTVQMRYVGARSSATPGLHPCLPQLTLPSVSVLEIDVPTELAKVLDSSGNPCRLNPGDNHGMVVFVSLSKTTVGRLSARARVDVREPGSSRRQTVVIDGSPLGYLDTTDNTHIASDLLWDKSGGTLSPSPVSSDCYVGTFFDGSRAGGVQGVLRLRDDQGSQVGHDHFFGLRPFEYVSFEDVFSLVGAAPAVYQGVRAEFSFVGKGDSVLAYCRTAMHLPAGLGRSFAYQIAQVVEPQEETRRRRTNVNSTPLVASPMPTFSIDPGENKTFHGIYVRHPDIVECSVTASDALHIAAVAPDRATVLSHPSARTPEFGLSTQSYQGWSDLWGIEISWSPDALRTAAVSYSIHCDSGNGTSLADQLLP
jgi:hypothetical protein